MHVGGMMILNWVMVFRLPTHLHPTSALYGLGCESYTLNVERWTD